MKSRIEEGEGEVPPHDHEITLCQIFDVHYPPYQCQAIGSECEHGSNKDAIQNQLDVHNGSPNEKKLQVIQHDRVRSLSNDMGGGSLKRLPECDCQ